jgi:hypothetical protein
MDTFQNAKDTFYTTLRDRLAVLNPDRTTPVRGAQRPAAVVEENEIAAGADPVANETFVLRWTEHAVDTSEAVPLVRGRCEIRYAVAGSAELAGMDRGRVLEAMDVELAGMLHPQQVLKQAYDSGAAVAMGTTVFWSDAAFGAVKMTADRVVRAVTVDVFAWKEPV